jgi:hypothetical protein
MINKRLLKIAGLISLPKIGGKQYLKNERFDCCCLLFDINVKFENPCFPINRE